MIKKISLLFAIAYQFYSLVIDAFYLMWNRRNIEDLIVKSLSEILERSLTMQKKDQILISQDFKEWLSGLTKDEYVWVIASVSMK